MTKEFFMDYLQAQSYDKLYQDIDVFDFKGYSGSAQTWEDIKDLVNWKGKVVVDLGAFHGYFCFKIEDRGAKTVYGLEGHPIYGNQILKTTFYIKESNGSNIILKYWNADSGDNVVECDVVLCLNSLHHFSNQENVLSKLKCKQAIFEVNKDQAPTVKKYFTVDKEFESHRPNRVILLGSLK